MTYLSEHLSARFMQPGPDSQTSEVAKGHKQPQTSENQARSLVTLAVILHGKIILLFLNAVIMDIKNNRKLLILAISQWSTVIQ